MSRSPKPETTCSPFHVSARDPVPYPSPFLHFQAQPLGCADAPPPPHLLTHAIKVPQDRLLEDPNLYRKGLCKKAHIFIHEIKATKK